ncbi:MAG: hypothetical protein ACI81T_000841 [Bacteroidia bacterium]|jgi:hypothetical protein
MPIRDSYILGFRYKYLNAAGKSKMLGGDTGSVTRDGISLNNNLIFFRDVHKTGRHKNNVVISLKPYATVNREISENIIKSHNSLVIKVDEILAEKVKSIIDRQCTAMIARDKWGHLTREQRDKQFTRTECARCEAIIDLTETKVSNLVYCKYCETLFDKFGYALIDSEEYKVCPECGYYGRVQDYYDFQAYNVYTDSEFSRRKHHCCDTCAHRMFQRNFWKNMLFIFGGAAVILEKIRSRRTRNPLYKDLQKANLLAQEGSYKDADVLYQEIILRNDRHPGIYMNHGKMFLEAGEREKAAFQFKKSLDSCSNYLPTLRVLQSNVDLDMDSIGFD